MRSKKFDRVFFWTSIALLVVGSVIFLSASLGLLARSEAYFSGIVFTHFVSIFLGIAAMAVLSQIDYRLLKKYSFYIFFATLGLTALVFIPHLGFEHGGAERWILLGPFSFQPAEFLKIGFILYLSTWLAASRARIRVFSYGLLPLLIMLLLLGLVLLNQPDTGTFAVIFGAALVLYFLSGAALRDIGVLFGAAVAGLGALAFFRPYVLERIVTFLNPAIDPQGASYQLQQALIAVGSGELWGRGFGQSVQKFDFLPEPVSDSIFAVFSEEFGFVGVAVLFSLLLVFTLRGFHIAKHAPDQFSRLTAAGLVILIIGQAFLNISSMINLFPLTGLPLPLVSHGGTAIIGTLAAVGILLNISRYQTK